MNSFRSILSSLFRSAVIANLTFCLSVKRSYVFKLSIPDKNSALLNYLSELESNSLKISYKTNISLFFPLPLETYLSLTARPRDKIASFSSFGYSGPYSSSL